MEHTAEELKAKLLEIYPDLGKHGLSLDVEYQEEVESWVIRLEKEGKYVRTFLERKDADACLEGVQCVHLGLQIGQFIDNFKSS